MTTFVSINDDILGVNSPGYEYGDDDVEVTIQPGIIVRSTNGDAIVSDRADSTLINNGQILSDSDVGVQLHGPNGAITNNTGGVINGLNSGVFVSGFMNTASATIVNHGEIRGQTGHGVSFSFSSGGNELTNHGLIVGAIAGVGASSRHGPSAITNFGTIESDQFGVLLGSGSSDVVTTILNGVGAKIRGVEAAIAIPSGGQIDLKNKGKIVGDIDCSTVDDSMDKVVNKGKIKGAVELGLGEDKFIFAGGKQGEVLGEADGDTFTFKRKLAPEKHVAEIGDFTPGEDTIVLSKGLFKGLGEKGALKGKVLHLGSKAADADDRVVYNENSGKLWHDPDGRGGAEAELIARLGDGLALKAGDFLVAA